MRFPATLSGIVVMWAILDASLGSPACPCQSQPSNCACQTQPARPRPPYDPSYSPPCNNCNDSCKAVQTLGDTVASLAAASPLYQVTATVMPGSEQIDGICLTFMPLNGLQTFLQFITTTWANGTYSVAVTLTSDTETAGVIRQEGLENESGESSVVTNSYAFGSVSCLGYTSLPLTAIYVCYLFSECSLQRATGDNLLVVADSPDVPDVCLDQAEALFDQAGFRKGVLARPCGPVGPKCVASYNGAPVINAGRIPGGNTVAYPPEPCDCAVN